MRLTSTLTKGTPRALNNKVSNPHEIYKLIERLSSTEKTVRHTTAKFYKAKCHLQVIDLMPLLCELYSNGFFLFVHKVVMAMGEWCRYQHQPPVMPTSIQSQSCRYAIQLLEGEETTMKLLQGDDDIRAPR